MIKLLIPLLAGCFFILGSFITKLFKKKDQMYLFSIGIALSTLLGIIVFDLGPEIFELLDNVSYKYLIIFTLMILGFSLFGFLDSFSHHHNHEKHNHDHIFHIGFVTSLFLILHNLVEGMTIYISALTSIKTGIFLAIAVGLHNIPLGMEVAISLELSKKENYKKIGLILILVLSTFMGGLIFSIFENSLNTTILGGLLSLTTGMALYIVFFELLKEIMVKKFKKPSIYGIICGSIIVILSLLI